MGLEADSGAVSCDQEGSTCPLGASSPSHHSDAFGVGVLVRTDLRRSSQEQHFGFQ